MLPFSHTSILKKFLQAEFTSKEKEFRNVCSLFRFIAALIYYSANLLKTI